ncbi:hypothetical protein J5N97_011549 [Dioscorea zingiberensis]|uniref:Uncharacterized protein n=1 Tax=Dioscorea zingiberensis TaxID=325984 RepID=A0A9D5D297_9LILI|nr:hypothetical protein J5N97_011549 [Dioscorea zingiberensis]
MSMVALMLNSYFVSLQAPSKPAFCVGLTGGMDSDAFPKATGLFYFGALICCGSFHKITMWRTCNQSKFPNGAYSFFVSRVQEHGTRMLFVLVHTVLVSTLVES